MKLGLWLIAIGLLMILIGQTGSWLRGIVAHDPGRPLPRCTHRLPAEYPACERQVEDGVYQLRLRPNGRGAEVWDGTRDKLLGHGLKANDGAQ